MTALVSNVKSLWCLLIGHSWRVGGYDFHSIRVIGQIIRFSLPIERCDRCGAVRLGRWPGGAE